VIKNRILLKEIPYGKFDSAIFTTYSLNLYYLEQQVLRLLHSKNIHYVSVLADSHMLTAQLNAYSFLSEQRKRNYALNGIQSSGAFHPKIIFLAGETSLLLLIGSGNLTSSGHGKNLEVWNPVYVNSDTDKKLGFVIQAWNYLKSLHSDLGISAQNKLKSIEENSGLLANADKIEVSDSYEIDAHSKISFLVENSGVSIYQQLSAIIGDEIITRITVMSPYYDSKGNLLHQLNKRFKPDVINAFLQKDFGIPPFNMEPENNIHFYYWENSQKENSKQDYFHAKNIVLEGKNRSFLLSGSANASMAAFGSDKFKMVNEEACILYQSTNADFVRLLDLNLVGDTINIKDIKKPSMASEIAHATNQNLVFVKAAEKDYEDITIYLNTKKQMLGSNICFFATKGEVLFNEEIDIEEGESTHQFERQTQTPILYCEVFNGASSVSNKQFVIDINSFESNNPSPNSKALNKIRKLGEPGSFSSLKIIGYLNTIYKQKEQKKDKISPKIEKEKEKDQGLIKENHSDLIYLPYEEIQKKIKLIDNSIGEKGYVEYKSVRLWESIFSYLKDSKEKEEQSKIDEEETEDISTSTGRAEKKKSRKKKPISESNYESLKKKVEKFLLKYQDILESKIEDEDSEKPNLIDLSMFLIILEILLHLLSHKEKIIDQDKEVHLLQISFINKTYSWSELVIHLIGLFTLWCSQKNGFKELDTYEYKHKLSLYKKMAFETSMSAIALFSAVNKNYNHHKIETWRNLCLLNADLVFNEDNSKYKDTEPFNVYVPLETMEEIGEASFSDEINESLRIVNTDGLGTGFYLHPVDGFTYIEKEIVNSKDKSLKFLKLISPGYKLDEDIHDFWNGKAYSISESRWLSMRKE
jgi:hypothetical protein